MSGSEEVLEVRITNLSATMHLDKDDGGRLAEAISEALEGIEEVRFIKDLDIDEVYTIEEY